MANEATEILGKNANTIQQLRILTASFYDLQKMRIEAGNRLTASFYIRIGYKPSEKTDEEDEAPKKFINQIKNEAKAVKDYMEAHHSREETAINSLNKDKKTKLDIIKDKSDFRIVESYTLLEKSEELMFKELESLVKTHPMYDKFFVNVKGCGPTMSAVILSYLDPYKAKYVSSFYKYCGLDTVHNKDANGNVIYLTKEDTPRQVIEKYNYYTEDGELYRGSTKDIKETNEFDKNDEPIYEDSKGNKYRMEKVMHGNEPVYTVIEDGSEYVGDVDYSEHGRRKGDVEDCFYTDKDGNQQIKKGITYNPKLKSKLIGVLAGTIKKCKDPVYCAIYDDYRKKLNENPKYKDYTDGHKHNMALRYMIKQFLRNLWVTWRDVEGLEINEPFEVAKLGMKPHKFNEYHYNMARIKNGEAAINYTGNPNVYSYSVYVDNNY